VRTPIVEVKNLNSFKSLRDAVEYELSQQARRWVETGKVAGPGAKVTRGWDEARGVTFVQREKEDAQDYRYFPDPDLPPVRLSAEWVARVREAMPELPLAKVARYVESYGLAQKEAAALAEDPHDCAWYESAIAAMTLLGVPEPRAGKAIANIVLQQAFRTAKERGEAPSALGVSSGALVALAFLRERGEISNRGVDDLFAGMVQTGESTAGVEALREVARGKGLLIVKDDAAMAGFVAKAIEAHAQAAADVRAGKQQAIGRLVGEVVKLSSAAGTPVDAKTAREELLKSLG
jgi:aspartyl-tRNA(Asn)/glutamyl-tRNA(Gln) amidotransferase subunit B